MQNLIKFSNDRQIVLDSRQVKPGDIFLAKRGDNTDGHKYLQSAVDAGACAVIVDHPVEIKVPSFVVEDTVVALQQIAVARRDSMKDLKVAAITGSCGKTTTRSFAESILLQKGSTIASVKSLNNHVGVPLTLLRVSPKHNYLVSEIGTNNAGEISSLVSLVKPDVAVITNIGPSHLAGFGSLEKIAEEKADIYDGLSADGIAIINADDRFADYFHHRNLSRKIITFGMSHSADVMATDVKLDINGFPSFRLHFKDENALVKLSMFGEHNVYNALAAAAIGFAFGLSIEQVVTGLRYALTEERRLVRHTLDNDVIVIDDSYNANPLSTSAALRHLSTLNGEKIFIFGDMKELGAEEITMHVQIGKLAKELGIDAIFSFGRLAFFATQEFGANGYPFLSKQDLITKLKSMISSKQVILVKGSNSMGMNEVVHALI